MRFFSLWTTMFENVGPNEALTSNLTKLSEINKNQTEWEDSNDPDLDLKLESDGQIKLFIFGTQYGSSSEEEEGVEQELVIESDNIKGRSCLLHPVVAVLEVKGGGLDAAFFGVKVRG